ncbi:MAG: VOC family protein [Candidatus Bathyarchaeota archaeon]|jgi:catechol 2,3-dioxygenase-like lactoylglutathione lyase family enzyme|nr:VOC family protein [Candidatus Bathyarchaeota archaeon]
MNSDASFDHILIVVKDLDYSIEFYNLIGFKHIETIQRPKDRVAVLKMGQVKIELMCLPEGNETYRLMRKDSDIGFRHIGIKVKNVNEIYQRLNEKIKFASPPIEIEGRPGRLSVFFHDPDGTELHFLM